jgi:hypothetical protein
MIIDTDMPEEMWPYATDSAIYIYNRLVNPKTKISPFTHWREELEIPNPEPSLKHLRLWGSTAYVHIPKPKRVQARQAAPRAWKGMLVGYEEDGGHAFKVWDPTAKKVVVSRDVGFPQPGDEDDMGPTPVQPAPGPNHKGPSTSGHFTSTHSETSQPCTTLNQRAAAEGLEPAISCSSRSATNCWFQ